jgi:hypothetical protein
MKRLIAAVLALSMMLATPAFAKGGSHGGGHHVNRGGHYAGGHGSSHKGGHYKNSRTGDHYTKRNK